MRPPNARRGRRSRGRGRLARAPRRGLHLLLADSLHVAKADSDDEPAAELVRIPRRRWVDGAFDVAEDAAAVGVWPRRGGPRAAAPRGPAHRAGRSPSAARSAARRGTPARSGSAARPTGRRAGRRRPSGPWGSRSRRSPGSAPRSAPPSPPAPRCSTAPATKRSWWARDRLLGALAAHRPAQPLRLRGGEAGQRHRHLDHLLLDRRSCPGSPSAPAPAAGARRGSRSRGPRAAACAARCRDGRRRPGSGPGGPAPPAR